MATIHFFDLPIDIIYKHIFLQLPDAALLSVRLVSTTGLKSIKELMEAPYTNKTLDGTEVSINFTGKFKKAGPAFFKHLMKMSALQAHPELLDVLASARSEMEREGHNGPFTIQHFLAYLKTFGEKGRLIPGSDQIQATYWKPGIWLDSLPLALVPFDLCEAKLTPTYHILDEGIWIWHFLGKTEALPLALSAAAEKNSLDLVMLVLSHPNASRFTTPDLLHAVGKSKLPSINLALKNHIYDQRTYSTLEKMAKSGKQYSPKEYAKIFIQFSFEVQERFYKNLCNKFGSRTGNVAHDGMVHFIKNPKKCLGTCLTG